MDQIDRAFFETALQSDIERLAFIHYTSRRTHWTHT
jgi:hypothetical protein